MSVRQRPGWIINKAVAQGLYRLPAARVSRAARDEALKIIFHELRATDDKDKQRVIVRRLQWFSGHYDFARSWYQGVNDKKNVIKWHSATQRAAEVAKWLTETPFSYVGLHTMYYPDEPPISETIKQLRKIVELLSNNPPKRRGKGQPTKLNSSTALLVRVVEKMYCDATGKGSVELSLQPRTSEARNAS
jgi:hypothetical protein